MKRSEQIGNLAAALAAAQKVMGAAAFDRENPHFRSKYATLASVMEAIKPIHDQDLALVQSALVLRIETTPFVEVETQLIHKSGEWISESISMKPGADTPQAIGSAMTYGRRYLAAALCGIASDDDDDGNAASEKPKQPAKKPEPKPEPKTPAPPQPPAPAEAPKPHAEKPATAPTITNTAEAVAAKIKRCRAMFAAQGVKSLDDFRMAVLGILGRKVEGMTDLSADELDAVIAELERTEAK